MLSNLIVMSTKADLAFQLKDFVTGKKSPSQFKTHKLTCAPKMLFQHIMLRRVYLSASLQNQLDEASEKSRPSLLNQLCVLCCLLRQGLSTRNDHAGGSNITDIGPKF